MSGWVVLRSISSIYGDVIDVEVWISVTPFVPASSMMSGGARSRDETKRVDVFRQQQVSPASAQINPPVLSFDGVAGDVARSLDHQVGRVPLAGDSREEARDQPASA